MLCVVWCAHFRQKTVQLKVKLKRSRLECGWCKKSNLHCFGLLLIFFNSSIWTHWSHNRTDKRQWLRKVPMLRSAHANINKSPINARIQNPFGFYMCNSYLHAIIELIKLEKENCGKWNVIVALSAKHKHAYKRCMVWVLVERNITRKREFNHKTLSIAGTINVILEAGMWRCTLYMVRSSVSEQTPRHFNDSTTQICFAQQLQTVSSAFIQF